MAVDGGSGGRVFGLFLGKALDAECSKKSIKGERTPGEHSTFFLRTFRPPECFKLPTFVEFTAIPGENGREKARKNAEIADDA
jgi:hypothetical protein